MRKLPKITEMEHITSKEFGENMDAILDRVTEEDIALIIDHNFKSYVLCPASWFEIPEIQHIETMIRNAVRYAAFLDESDIDATADMLKEFMPVLSAECIDSLLKAIEGRNAGMQNSQWQDMKAALEKALTTTEKEE